MTEKEERIYLIGIAAVGITIGIIIGSQTQETLLPTTKHL